MKTSDEYTWCYGENFQWRKVGTASTAALAIGSARQMVNLDQALPFDIKPAMDQAMQQWKQTIAERYFIRSASVTRMASNQIPVIDGNLNDQAWQTAPLDAFQPRASSMKAVPDVATRAWVTYDDEGLSIALWCEEPETAQLQIQSPPPDDSVQVFISTGTECIPYKMFGIKPFAHTAWDDDGTAQQSKWQWATHVDGQQLVRRTEIALVHPGGQARRHTPPAKRICAAIGPAVTTTVPGRPVVNVLPGTLAVRRVEIPPVGSPVIDQYFADDSSGGTSIT